MGGATAPETATAATTFGIISESPCTLDVFVVGSVLRRRGRGASATAGSTGRRGAVARGTLAVAITCVVRCSKASLTAAVAAATA